MHRQEPLIAIIIAFLGDIIAVSCYISIFCVFTEFSNKFKQLRAPTLSLVLFTRPGCSWCNELNAWQMLLVAFRNKIAILHWIWNMDGELLLMQ